MSTAKKTKKTGCKYASPICNDRAEAFVGPKPDILPMSSEIPSERDARAFELSAKGMKQRDIAKELKTSQPTVHRAIKKYRLWFGMTLPEDRGELVGWARFRVAMEERKIFLRHQQELAMEEWHQSRQPMTLKRKRTKLDPQGEKLDGMPIKEIQIDEVEQRRHASAAHLNAAAKRSEELIMLEAGYLGVRKLTCDQVMDPDERDRWDRAMKSHEATIQELTRKVAELEAKLAAQSGSGVFGASDCASGQTQPPKSPDPLGSAPSSTSFPDCRARGSGLFGSKVAGSGDSLVPKTPDPGPMDESRKAQNTPAQNQELPDSQAASPAGPAPSSDGPDSSPLASESMNPMNPVGVPALAGPPQPRWSDEERQEALDYHCRMHNLPFATLAQASGIPNPRHITPLEAIKRGFPYLIYIDRTAENERDWNRREWERMERLKREAF